MNVIPFPAELSPVVEAGGSMMTVLVDVAVRPFWSVGTIEGLQRLRSGLDRIDDHFKVFIVCRAERHRDV